MSAVVAKASSASSTVPNTQSAERQQRTKKLGLALLVAVAVETEEALFDECSEGTDDSAAAGAH